MGRSPRPAGGVPQLEIVVPAYNEERRLPLGLALLEERLASLPVPAEIIVVDNASTDGTADVVRGWNGRVPVRLLHCAERGKGAAVRTGLLATTARHVGFCDADMATDLSALDTALRLLEEGHPVVVGSRRHPGSLVEGYGQPLRRVGALAFNLMIRDLVGGIADTQCGFKFFAGPLARQAAAELRTTGFSFDVELLLHCTRRGAAIIDIPVIWHDMPGTTFSMRRHAMSCLRDLLRIRRMAAPRPDTAASTAVVLAMPEPPAPGTR
ncbi:glycosyltransferase [Thermomonospora cellulosilytica]|uniref:Glycosyltransferase involved in cell wall biosynthesis n=1 Tax=Thermomonospora cellulosilytica TaxID=1411118 RepID=A0A7W3N5H9_9ACTN|nr:glycosyltransferase [Thermomonospora cellulosilytica]MBA9007837.1 glycosyltransferase involved in cell wall biosynthesis [Thermomonospora cellulosilytica]